MSVVAGQLTRVRCAEHKSPNLPEQRKGDDVRTVATVLLGFVLFVNMRPGQYIGTCDEVPMICNVGADGTLAADCDRISVALTSGASVTCKERER